MEAFPATERREEMSQRDIWLNETKTKNTTQAHLQIKKVEIKQGEVGMRLNEIEIKKTREGKGREQKKGMRQRWCQRLTDVEKRKRDVEGIEKDHI